MRRNLWSIQLQSKKYGDIHRIVPSYQSKVFLTVRYWASVYPVDLWPNLGPKIQEEKSRIRKPTIRTKKTRLVRYLCSVSYGLGKPFHVTRSGVCQKHELVSKTSELWTIFLFCRGGQFCRTFYFPVGSYNFFFRFAPCVLIKLLRSSHIIIFNLYTLYITRTCLYFAWKRKLLNKCIIP